MKTQMTQDCCIDDMEELLQQLQDFEQQLHQHHLDTPAFRQELDMFSKYLKWKLEDFHRTMRQDLNAQIKSLG